jgi:predicted cupin superfamily sugar epimerase
MLLPDGTGAVATVGSDLASGMRPMLFIPANTFHTSRMPNGGFALLGSTEWPGVEPPDVENGDREKLLSAFPKMRKEILSFMG